MSILVHNGCLDYYVGITAELWRSLLLEWLDRNETKENADLIIGIDGTPLIVPHNAALYDGEWVLDVYELIADVLEMNRIRNATPAVTKALIRCMTDYYVEHAIADLSLRGEGIVNPEATYKDKSVWWFVHGGNNGEAVPTIAYAKRDDSRYSDPREAIVARYEYDIVHNTQYLIDNIGYYANRQR